MDYRKRRFIAIIVVLILLVIGVMWCFLGIENLSKKEIDVTESIYLPKNYEIIDRPKFSRPEKDILFEEYKEITDANHYVKIYIVPTFINNFSRPVIRVEYYAKPHDSSKPIYCVSKLLTDNLPSTFYELKNWKFEEKIGNKEVVMHYKGRSGKGPNVIVVFLALIFFVLFCVFYQGIDNFFLLSRIVLWFFRKRTS